MKKVLIDEGRATKYLKLSSFLAGNPTVEQQCLLGYDCFSLDNEDEERLYKGAGHGWVEFDRNGRMVSMRFIEKDAPLEDDGDIVPNVCNFPFQEKDVAPFVTPSGNMRMRVNFVGYDLLRY